MRNERMCLRKRVFWSAFSARARARTITENGTPMRAYRCPNCFQYHLSSKVKT